LTSKDKKTDSWVSFHQQAFRWNCQKKMFANTINIIWAASLCNKLLFNFSVYLLWLSIYKCIFIVQICINGFNINHHVQYICHLFQVILRLQPLQTPFHRRVSPIHCQSNSRGRILQTTIFCSSMCISHSQQANKCMHLLFFLESPCCICLIHAYRAYRYWCWGVQVYTVITQYWCWGVQVYTVITQYSNIWVAVNNILPFSIKCGLKYNINSTMWSQISL
jgi:hypothetical protein